jgi:hypothetical protein
MNLVQAILMVTEDEASNLVHILEDAEDNVSDITYIKDAIKKGYL